MTARMSGREAIFALFTFIVGFMAGTQWGFDNPVVKCAPAQEQKK